MIGVDQAVSNCISLTSESVALPNPSQQFSSASVKILRPTAVALGNFDGVHRGHRQVIEPILNFRSASLANESIPLNQFSRQTYATVVSFDPHPREFFTGKTYALLTPLKEKVQQMQNVGVEQLAIFPFNQELANLSPQQFVEKILVQQLGAQQISVGEDFCFGKARAGTTTDLRAIAATYNIPVTIVPLQKSDRERISSSLIRQALLQGDLEYAKQLLGRPYTLTGTLIKSQQQNRTACFPTAMLQLPPEKLIPRQGIYGGRVSMEEGAKLVVTNIYIRPTANETSSSVEVHLLDWVDELYNKTVTVYLEKFLRPEPQTVSQESLRMSIQADS